MIRSGSKLRGTACVILRGPGRQDPMEKTRPGSILLGAGLGESAGLLFKRWQSRKLCAIEAPGKGHDRQGLEPRRHGHAQLFPHTEPERAAGAQREGPGCQHKSGRGPHLLWPPPPRGRAAPPAGPGAASAPAAASALCSRVRRAAAPGAPETCACPPPSPSSA